MDVAGELDLKGLSCWLDVEQIGQVGEIIVGCIFILQFCQEFGYKSFAIANLFFNAQSMSRGREERISITYG